MIPKHETQEPWSLSFKNAPAYFITTYTKKYLLDPVFGDQISESIRIWAFCPLRIN